MRLSKQSEPLLCTPVLMSHWTQAEGVEQQTGEAYDAFARCDEPTMASYAETLGLSDTGFELLRDLIHERTGLFYENGKCDLLLDKLSPLIIERGFNSFLDYYY